MCAAALGVGAVAAYVGKAPSLRPYLPAPEPSPSVEVPKPLTHEASPTAQHPQSVLVFVPTMGADGISFTKMEVTVPENGDPKLVAVNEFLRASEIAPTGAHALLVDIRDDGIAMIEFNKAFDQTYGTFDEKKLLDGLAAAMGQFPDVNAFTLYFEDQPVKTLGSADLTSPIKVIRPNAVPMTPTQSRPPEEPTNPK